MVEAVGSSARDLATPRLRAEPGALGGAQARHGEQRIVEGARVGGLDVEYGLEGELDAELGGDHARDARVVRARATYQRERSHARFLARAGRGSMATLGSTR